MAIFNVFSVKQNIILWLKWPYEIFTMGNVNVILIKIQHKILLQKYLICLLWLLYIFHLSSHRERLKDNIFSPTRHLCNLKPEPFWHLAWSVSCNAHWSKLPIFVHFPNFFSQMIYPILLKLFFTWDIFAN